MSWYDEPNIHDVKRGVLPQREHPNRGVKKDVQRDWLVVTIGQRWVPWKDREKRAERPLVLQVDSQHTGEEAARKQVEKVRHREEYVYAFLGRRRYFYCHRDVLRLMKPLWEGE